MSLCEVCFQLDFIDLCEYTRWRRETDDASLRLRKAKWETTYTGVDSHKIEPPLFSHHESYADLEDAVRSGCELCWFFHRAVLNAGLIFLDESEASPGNLLSDDHIIERHRQLDVSISSALSPGDYGPGRYIRAGYTISLLPISQEWVEESESRHDTSFLRYSRSSMGSVAGVARIVLRVDMDAHLQLCAESRQSHHSKSQPVGPHVDLSLCKT